MNVGGLEVGRQTRHNMIWQQIERVEHRVYHIWRQKIKRDIHRGR